MKHWMTQQKLENLKFYYELVVNEIEVDEILKQ